MAIEEKDGLPTRQCFPARRASLYLLAACCAAWKAVRALDDHMADFPLNATNVKPVPRNIFAAINFEEGNFAWRLFVWYLFLGSAGGGKQNPL